VHSDAALHVAKREELFAVAALNLEVVDLGLQLERITWPGMRAVDLKG